jgi:hypothetical protein
LQPPITLQNNNELPPDKNSFGEMEEIAGDFMWLNEKNCHQSEMSPLEYHSFPT